MDTDERKLLHTRYWSIGSDNQRRRYILAINSTKDPAPKVCANVFFSTLRATREFVCYTREHVTQGFNKPDGRGHKLQNSKTQTN